METAGPLQLPTCEVAWKDGEQMVQQVRRSHDTFWQDDAEDWYIAIENGPFMDDLLTMMIFRIYVELPEGTLK